MSEKKFREWISSEFEKEADDLERRLKEREAANPELAAMKMPDDSFDDLMRRIEAGKKAETGDLEKETGTDHVVSLAVKNALLAHNTLPSSSSRA